MVATALRIITRLKKDWIATGRRPDGICALAMMVSARAHDFEVNQDVICKLFRVSPDLLRRRIGKTANPLSCCCMCSAIYTIWLLLYDYYCISMSGLSLYLLYVRIYNHICSCYLECYRQMISGLFPLPS